MGAIHQSHDVRFQKGGWRLAFRGGRGVADGLFASPGCWPTDLDHLTSRATHLGNDLFGTVRIQNGKLGTLGQSGEDFGIVPLLRG